MVKEGFKKQFYIIACLIVFLLVILLIIYFQKNISLAPIGGIETKIWFAPNKGSIDYRELFLQEDLWSNTLRNVDIFEFHPEVLYSNLVNPCPQWSWCVNVSYPKLVELGAFEKLNEWGVEIATGAGVVKHWDCVGTQALNVANSMIQNINLAGSNLSYLVMDEPYIGGELEVNGQSCGFTMEQSAAQTAFFVNSIRNAHPNIKIGDAEPYPYYNSQEIINWVLELESLGVNLDFFQLDVAHGLPIDINELSEIKNFFESKNIPYGVIYWANTDFPGVEGSSAQWFSDVFSWVQLVKNNNLDGVHHHFNSWEFANPLPIILPENLTGQSHTNLILSTLPILLDNNASFLAQNVPTTMVAGQSYLVSVSFLNNGDETWHGKKLYGLGAQNPSDNILWGVNRVYLSSIENVYSDQEKTFEFIVTAPSTPGNYNFQWKMIHERIEWFGQSTNNVLINVQPSGGSAPNPPSNLNVEIFSPTSTIINWQDNSSNEDGFRLEYRTAGQNNWFVVPGASNLNANTEQFIHNALPTGQTYEYRVGAYVSEQISFSNIFSINFVTGPIISSITPNSIVNDRDIILYINGTNFDPENINFAGIVLPLSSGLWVSSPPNLVNLLIPQNLLGVGDYPIQIINFGNIISNSMVLRINYPFDYVLSLDFSEISVNSGSIIDNSIKIEDLIYMIHENVNVNVQAPSGINVNFVGPNYCQINVSTTPNPSCSIYFNISTTSLSAGQYVVNFTANSSATNVSHQVNFTININVPSVTTTGSSSGSSSGSSGSGSGGNIVPNIIRQCNDNLDNDNDGRIDYPNDLGCSSSNDNSELDPSEIVESNYTIGEENPGILNGSTEDVKIRIVFWLVLLSLICGIVIVSILIINSLRLNKINYLANDNSRF